MNVSVMQKALGKQWDNLGSSVKKHYDLTPGNDGQITVEGIMDEVTHSLWAKPFIVIGQLFGALVPYRGQNVPVIAKNWTDSNNSQALFWHRTFSFIGKQPYIFESRMEHYKDDEIVEYVRFNLGVRMRLSVKDGSLVYKNVDYIWKLGKLTIHIPNWLTLGSADIIETPISDSLFKMDFTMKHPLFGLMFCYCGEFEIKNS
jgi:hypothetical protein